jgi:anti-sigma factor RsiW
MRCREVRRLLITEEIVGYGPPPRGSLRRHLDRCEMCREEAVRLDREAELIRRAFATLAVRADFTDEVLRRLAGEA